MPLCKGFILQVDRGFVFSTVVIQLKEMSAKKGMKEREARQIDQ